MPAGKSGRWVTTFAGCGLARRTPVGDQPRSRLLRCRAGHAGVVESGCAGDDPARHHLHQRGAHRRRQAWWEGLDDRVPAFDWRGRLFDPANGPAAHPNARFTVSAAQCPSWSPRAEDLQGVSISAIVFGTVARRICRLAQLRRLRSARRLPGALAACLQLASASCQSRRQAADLQNSDANEQRAGFTQLGHRHAFRVALRSRSDGRGEVRWSTRS